MDSMKDAKGALLKVKEVATLGHEGGITSVCFSPCGRYLASSSYDDTVKLWDVDSMKNAKGPLL